MCCHDSGFRSSERTSSTAYPPGPESRPAQTICCSQSASEKRVLPSSSSRWTPRLLMAAGVWVWAGVGVGLNRARPEVGHNVEVGLGVGVAVADAVGVAVLVDVGVSLGS